MEYNQISMVAMI